MKRDSDAMASGGDIDIDKPPPEELTAAAAVAHISTNSTLCCILKTVLPTLTATFLVNNGAVNLVRASMSMARLVLFGG